MARAVEQLEQQKICKPGSDSPEHDKICADLLEVDWENNQHIGRIVETITNRICNKLQENNGVTLTHRFAKYLDHQMEAPVIVDPYGKPRIIGFVDVVLRFGIKLKGVSNRADAHPYEQIVCIALIVEVKTGRVSIGEAMRQLQFYYENRIGIKDNLEEYPTYAKVCVTPKRLTDNEIKALEKSNIWPVWLSEDDPNDQIPMTLGI